VLLLV